jgi:alkylation response protein AidB-like acyl-CoA dehydrogenase
MHGRDAAIAAAQRVADEVVAPIAEQWDAEAAWRDKSIRALLAEGLGGPVVPAEHGDLGLGLRGLDGATAYRDGSKRQRPLRDARASHVMSPTSDILFTPAGRTLLDLPLLGE